MSAPSEPEKYSIDDMMDRLKKRPAEEPIENGELVTRSDGSQAIRVRKRKRRSHQPHKEEEKQSRRGKMVQVSAALILILLFVFTIGAAIIFANSAPFRKGLLEKITQTSGASVELEQFRMNPTSANAARLILTWPESNALASLSLRNIRAEISPSAFFGKSMTGQEASASEGALVLRIPNTNAANEAASDKSTVRFGVYSIPKLQILIEDASAPLARLLNTSASFTSANVNDRAQLLLSNGDIRIKGWPKLLMDRSHIEFRGREVDIIGMRLKYEPDPRGSFELAGTVSPYSSERPSTLAVQLDGYQFAGIAGEKLGKLFAGKIDTSPSSNSNSLSFTPGTNPTTSLLVSFTGTLPTSMELSGFPFLFGLSQTLEDDWFAQPSFDAGVSGTLLRAGGDVTLSKLDFSNKGRMALQGDLTLSSNQRLSGNLNVGIADAMIDPAKNRRLHTLFSPAKDGFRWLTLKIGGSASAPTDNFKDLFNAAQVPARPAPSEKIPSFEELTNPE